MAKRRWNARHRAFVMRVAGFEIRLPASKVRCRRFKVSGGGVRPGGKRGGSGDWEHHDRSQQLPEREAPLVHSLLLRKLPFPVGGETAGYSCFGTSTRSPS